MASTDLISIFKKASPPRRTISSLWISMTSHGVAVGILSCGVLYNPAIRDPMLRERYSVRHLDLRAAEAKPQPGEMKKAQNPGSPSSPVPQAAAAAASDQAREVPRVAQGKRTLVQPDFQAPRSMSEETPLPTVIIWTPEQAATARIVPPPPEETTAANVHPSLASPNEEVDLADISFATDDTTSKTTPLETGSSSPITIDRPELAQMPPATVTNVAEQPTPTAVLSVSDARMVDGTMVLPPVNEARMPSIVTGASQGHASNPANSPIDAARAVTDSYRGSASPLSSSSQSSEDRAPDADHIIMPKNGRFGVVVVGTSLAEEYPETQQIWHDRVAYTTYLHVGLSKNWIMQYSQLRTVEADHGGEVERLEAPWPYDIYRPSLVSRDLNADALMVHGVVNEAGRFESLAIAFPTEYEHSGLVLLALRRWQFRPARQNGRTTAVEVLLIIPDELD